MSKKCHHGDLNKYQITFGHNDCSQRQTQWTIRTTAKKAEFLFYWKIKKLKNDILSLKYGEIRIFHHLNKKDFFCTIWCQYHIILKGFMAFKINLRLFKSIHK